MAPRLPRMEDLPRLTTLTAIGIAVAISGNIIISLALNLQKLAHKRLDNLKNGTVATELYRQNLPTPPSLNEQDEDAESTTNHSPPENPQTTTSETQPLLPIHNRNRNHTTFEREDLTSEVKPQKMGFFFRLFRSKKDHGKKKRTTVLPVDVMAEDTALHGLQSSRKTTSDGEGENEDETAYLKSKLWWSGFFLMNVGELGNFISYAFAPASVVAPLGTFALIANCVFAPVLLGEHFRKRDFLGICVAIVGAVTVVLSSNASDIRLDPQQLVDAIKQTPFLVYTGCYIIGVITLATLSQGRLGRTYVYIDVGLCALFGGFTVLSTKALSTIITMKWYGIFAEWVTYPLILTLVGTGVGQIRYLNRALMRFEGKAVIPTQFVFFTLSAIMGSAILYGDFKKAGFHEVVTFLYGCAATFAGVFILANGGNGSDEEPTTHTLQPDDEAVEDGVRLGMGTIGKRQRATLVLPSGMESPRDTPSLRRKRSSVVLVGISPAQHLLLAHTPSHENRASSRERDNAHEGGEVASPSSYGRTRMLHGPGYDGTWNGSPQSRTNTLRGNTSPERLRSPQIFGSPTHRNIGGM